MKLLFICTHNRCRSILAEAITNFYGEGVLFAKSAGSQPAGKVHPLTLKFLKEWNIPTEGLLSKSWDEIEHWQPDIVVTVCDSAVNEPCPVWFGKSVRFHWGLADPSSVSGDDKEIAGAFDETISILKSRIEKLVELEVQKVTGTALSRIFNEVDKL